MCHHAQYASGGSLKNRLHIEDKPNKCDTSGIHFAQACHMRTHIRTLTVEKSHRHDMCGAQFVQTDSLKSHTRTRK